MVKYKVQKSDDLFEVLETETGNIIKSELTNSQAKDLCRRLNFGGGFDGWTPSFFNENIKGLVYSEENFYK